MPTSYPFFRWRQVALAISLSFALPGAQAALTVNATRIVYDSDKRSTSVVVANPSEHPYAVQTWVNTEADDTTTAVPLLVTPTLFRLDAQKQQLVQISALGNTLPQDRESLFFFNVQEIPQSTATDKNTLSIALRTRLKVFYRPSGLKGTPSNHIKDLRWSLHEENGKLHLRVHNPSPYHYTFGRLEVINGTQTEQIQSSAMALPMQTQSYSLSKIRTPSAPSVRFTTINDYGGSTDEVTLALQFVQP
ncbi:fimbrial biogenesis chaperone [Pseudomonas putida]|uniref:fimbrial biogenesis chaperone n=1 Tax=Pseudomonas putida TaxID=303 RepID=UPI002657C0DF|nr:molecular chaperone [Pseudomonas putida]MCZ9636568.1 molecular chaperone [Pseudomonas putida]